METVLRGTGKETVIGPGRPFCIIGERINPTGKKRLTRAIREADWSHLQRMAVRQVEAGAGVIDVNVGVPGVNEPEAMRSAVKAIQEVVDVPISLDSSTIESLLVGMEAVEGRPLVNSVPAEPDYMRRLLPAIKDRDAAMIGICMRGGASMPESAGERLEIARTLLAESEKHGIAPEDVIIDVIVLTIGADHRTALTSLDSIRRVTQELGNNTTVGLSNISFGLPNRSFLNAIMVAMAAQAGLTAAVVDPTSPEMRRAVRALDMFKGNDEYCANWIEAFRREQTEMAAQEAESG